MPRGRLTPPEDPDFEPGEVVGSYRIEQLIARGGMSAIYRAADLARDRVVALKVLSTTYGRDPISRGRFMNESRIAAALRHPNILAAYDSGEVGDRLILAMELIRGTDLARRLRSDGAVPPPEAVRMLEQIAAALDAAHAVGLVHRDVKPGNILLEGDRALLTDFGLAKLLGSSQTLTLPGRMVGTTEYLSPEQIRGQRITPQTDIYGLGCVIFETLTGTPPFTGSDFVVMRAHLEQPIPQMVERTPGLPSSADDVVTKAMNKRAAERFDSAALTIRALKRAFGYD
jgi:serine/threonine protein kinase